MRQEDQSDLSTVHARRGRYSSTATGNASSEDSTADAVLGIEGAVCSNAGMTFYTTAGRVLFPVGCIIGSTLHWL